MKALIAVVGAYVFGTPNARSGRVWTGLMFDRHALDALVLRLGGIKKLHSSMAAGSPVIGVSGNLGFLTYFPEGPSSRARGANLVGASRAAANWPLSGFELATACPKGHKPEFSALPGRDQDSEYLLLNCFDAEFKGEAKGHLALITERLPCSSCEGVIVKFLTKYPCLQMHLGYFVESPEDSREGRAAALAATLHKVSPGNEIWKLIPKNNAGVLAKSLDDLEWKQLPPRLDTAGISAFPVNALEKAFGLAVVVACLVWLVRTVLRRR